LSFQETGRNASPRDARISISFFMAAGLAARLRAQVIKYSAQLGDCGSRVFLVSLRCQRAAVAFRKPGTSRG
jgi:hypothetical protein